MKTFSNILVVRTDRMGDVVLTVPAIRALKEKFPGARVSVWLDPSTKPLLDGLPFIDEIIIQNKASGWRGYFDLVLGLGRRKFDLAAVYHTKRKTNIACALAGIPYRLGYKNEKCGWLLTHPVEDRRHLGEKHESLYCMDLLSAIGISSSDMSLELGSDIQAERWADDFCKDSMGGVPFIAIHPDASCSTRCWPAASFASVIDGLEGMGMNVLLVGSSTAVPCAAQISARAKTKVIDMTGKTTLPQLISLFRRARAVVSNDSGPVHVAAALGVPIVSIFLRKQPGINPTRWKPLGPKSRVVVPPEGQEIMLDSNSNIISGSFDAITPDQVLKALGEVL